MLRLLAPRLLNSRVDGGLSPEGGKQIFADVASHLRLDQRQHGRGQTGSNRQHRHQELRPEMFKPMPEHNPRASLLNPIWRS